jgi:cyclopropane-fatty-acyl-phospholipid synthase
MMDAKAADRLESFRWLATHVRALLKFDFGFVLWDGSTVPADWKPDDLAIVIADEGVVAAMVRRPSLNTLFNLLVSARIDIRGGWMSDLILRREKVRNKDAIKGLDKGLAIGTAMKFLFVPRGGPWPLDAMRGDTTPADGSEASNKANIHYHYDLSNDFYALFLDPEMVYSCAYYQTWTTDLATAQRDKLDIICRKLRLKPGETFLDVGCGWGGLICHAAQHYGVKAHGLTLAEQQFSYVQEKVARLGLEGQVTVELRDYSAVGGSYDKIASVGMFEHVGVPNYQTYFETIHRLLNHGGLYLHHAMAYRWKDFMRTRRHKPQAIQIFDRYVFPGGDLDYIGLTTTNLERYGFEVHDVEGWREHYARTNALWRDRLAANFEAAAAHVGAPRARLWIAFLDGASAGYVHGSIGIFQTLASKRERGPAKLPPTRADIYR